MNSLNEKWEGNAWQEQAVLSAEQLHGLHNLQRGIDEVVNIACWT